jgi:hypothetical protein
MKKLLFLHSWAAVCLFLNGCSVLRMVSEVWVADDFQPGHLETSFDVNALHQGGLAILPVLVGEDTKEGNALASQLDRRLKKTLSGTNVISGPECYRILDQAGLNPPAAAALRNYKRAPLINDDLMRSIEEDVLQEEYGGPYSSAHAFWAFKDLVGYFKGLDQKELSEMGWEQNPVEDLLAMVPVDMAFLEMVGQILQVRYLLQVDVNHFQDHVDGFGALLNAASGVSGSSFPFSLNNSAYFGAYCQIWDCSLETVVWSGFAATSSPRAEEPDHYNGNRNEHAEVAARNLAGMLPKAKH